MGTCQHCGTKAKTVSRAIGFCVDCIRRHFEQVWPEIKKVHDQSRKAYGLPLGPPRADRGTPCSFCFHECRIPDGSRGFCGLRRAEAGKIIGGRPHEGNLYMYHDPLPTNCVAGFVCPAGTGCGYPRYAASSGPEYGYKNLAVFYHACSFNCLYCQNFQFKKETMATTQLPARQLADAVDQRTTCICYFGGDPTPQILHALKASRLALAKASGRILRICWETNGCTQEPFLTTMAELSLSSGGCIKVDLKAWNETVHYALCGVTNKKTIENFQALSRWVTRRTTPPFLVASTLLVPGYVDEEEVAGIARFIAAINPEMPYSLLAFYPHFYLSDLPATSRKHALRCQEIAQEEGLRNVHLGNVHLLGEAYG